MKIAVIFILLVLLVGCSLNKYRATNKINFADGSEITYKDGKWMMKISPSDDKYTLYDIGNPKNPNDDRKYNLQISAESQDNGFIDGVLSRRYGKTEVVVEDIEDGKVVKTTLAEINPELYNRITSNKVEIISLEVTPVRNGLRVPVTEETKSISAIYPDGSLVECVVSEYNLKKGFVIISTKNVIGEIQGAIEDKDGNAKAFNFLVD
jgi:hypothetical protein